MSSGDPLTCRSAHFCLQSHRSAITLSSQKHFSKFKLYYNQVHSEPAPLTKVWIWIQFHVQYLSVRKKEGTQRTLKAEWCASWLKLWHPLENNETLSSFLILASHFSNMSNRETQGQNYGSKPHKSTLSNHFRKKKRKTHTLNLTAVTFSTVQQNINQWQACVCVCIYEKNNNKNVCSPSWLLISKDCFMHLGLSCELSFLLKEFLSTLNTHPLCDWWAKLNQVSFYSTSHNITLALQIG